MKIFHSFLIALIAIIICGCNSQPTVVADPIEPRPDSLDYYIEQATKTNDSKIQYYAGSLLLKKYAHNDSIKGIEFLKQAASQEYGMAENRLGTIYGEDSTNSYYDIKRQ